MYKPVIRILKSRFYSQKDFYISIFWGSLAGIFSQGLNFITNVFLARTLGKGFGELVLYTSTNTMFQTFSLLGLNIIASVLVAENLNLNRIRLGQIIPNLYFIVSFLTIIISIIALMINEMTLFSFKFWTIHSNMFLIFIIIWLIFSSLDVLQISILAGLGAFRDLAKVTLIKGILSIILILTFVRFFGLEGAIVGYGLSFTVSFILNLHFLNNNRKKYGIIFNYNLDFKIIQRIFISSLPIFLASFALVPSQWGVNYILFNKVNGSLALTVFGIANQWMALIQFFPLQISKVVLPFLTKQKDNIYDYKRTERTGLIISILIGIVLIALSFIFESQIIKIYKINYSVMKTPFRIMVLAALFSILNLYLGQNLIANGRSWLRMILDCLISISLFISFIFFVSKTVIFALPLSYCVAFIVGSSLIIIIRRSNRFTKQQLIS